MQKGFTPIILLVGCLIVASILTILYTFQSTKTNKLQVCPQAWIQNKMPRILEDKDNNPREYFVLEGKRRELSEFDLDWVKSNCKIQPTKVY